jgi:hypothetical protein
VQLVIVVAVAACHRGPSPRERVLTVLPGAAVAIAVADGSALADPGLRPVVDRARALVPARLGCVIDAALASRTTALAIDHGDVVVAIDASGEVNCPELAKVAPGLWIATVGQAAPVDRHASAWASPRWARAQPYLVDAPLAFAAELHDRHVIAAAQAEPFQAWVAIDRPGLPQAIVHPERIDLDDLAPVLRTLLALDDAPPPAAPAHAPVVISVHSLAAIHVEAAPVVASGDLLGLRLTADAPPLRRGDIVLGVDGTPVRSPDEFVRALGHRNAVTIAVRRDGKDQVFHVGQNE